MIDMQEPSANTASSQLLLDGVLLGLVRDGAIQDDRLDSRYHSITQLFTAPKCMPQ
jgi:hypothetical protein